MKTSKCAKKMEALATEDVTALLNNWVALNKDVMSLPIEAVKQLLDAEVKLNGGRRSQVILRLYGRYNRLRENIERQKLLRGEKL